MKFSSDTTLLFQRYLNSLLLASASKGRKEILEKLGCKVDQIILPYDEHSLTTLKKGVVEELACSKMEQFLNLYPSPTLPVITADTLVGFNGELIGKPETKEEAAFQLSLLSKKSHLIYSGFALYYPPLKSYFSGSDTTEIRFTEIPIEEYLETGEWQGAAGSYRIQGEASRFVSEIKGSMSTVVGLPIEAISAILTTLG